MEESMSTMNTAASTALPSTSCTSSSSMAAGENDDNGSSGWIIWSLLHRVTSRHCRTVLAIWLLMFPPCGLYSLPRILAGADSTFRPLAGTPSADATRKYAEAYYANSEGDKSGGNGMQEEPIVALLQMDSDDETGSNATLIDGKSNLSNSARTFMLDYQNYILDLYPTSAVESYYTFALLYPTLASATFASHDGRTTVIKFIPPPSFTSKSDLLSFANVVTSYPAATAASTAASISAQYSRQRQQLPKGVSISYTGLLLFQRDLTLSSHRDITRLDTTSLPLSLLLLTLALGCPLPLLLIPISIIVATVCLWSTLLYALMCFTNLPVVQTAPSVMMSLTIAMGFDYTLFYLSRTLEEIRSYRHHPQQPLPEGEAGRRMEMLKRANSTALRTAGHSILLSGCTLSVCLLGLVVLPLDMMVSIGVGSSVAVLSCVVVSLTLIPAILERGGWLVLWMVFGAGNGSRGEGWGGWWWWLGCGAWGGGNQRGGDDGDDDEEEEDGVVDLPSLLQPLIDCDNNGESFVEDERREGNKPPPVISPLLSPSPLTTPPPSFSATTTTTYLTPPSSSQSHNDPRKRLWIRTGRYILSSHRRSIILLSLLLLLFILPVSIFIIKLRTSIAIDLMVPYSSPALKTFRTLGNVFRRGSLTPYKLVFGLVEGDAVVKTMDSREGFEFMHSVLLALTAMTAERGGHVDNAKEMMMRRWRDGDELVHHSFSREERRAILEEFYRLGDGETDDVVSVGDVNGFNGTARNVKMRPSSSRCFAYKESLSPTNVNQDGGVVLVDELWDVLVHHSIDFSATIQNGNWTSTDSCRVELKESEITIEKVRVTFELIALQALGDMERMEAAMSKPYPYDVISMYDYSSLRYAISGGAGVGGEYNEENPPSSLLSLAIDSVNRPLQEQHRRLPPNAMNNPPIVVPGSNTTTTNEGGAIMVPGTSNLSSFSGISALNGILIPYSIYEISILCDSISRVFSNNTYHCPVEAMRTLALFSNETCNPSHTNTYITTVLEVDPYRSEGIAWLDSARQLLNNAAANNTTFEAFLLDGAAIEYDAVRVVYAYFPRMVAVTTSVVLVFLAGAFRSVGATFRSVLSIGVTLSFVYGLTVLVYRYGILDWTGVRGLSPSGTGGAEGGETEGGDEISFLPPLMAFTVVVGLGLDYDVFLTTRILEYRQQTTASTPTMIGEDAGAYRITHTDSILLGSERTGGIITYAGVIMFVAFGGLLWSECTVLNQFAFFLVSAVLLDTFVVRTVLVPIVLELCGEKWGWWPRTFED